MGAEPVDRAVLHAQRHHPDALPLVHDEIQREVLDEKLRVVAQSLAVQSVEHRVPGAIRRARAPVRLAALAEVEALPAERALVNLPVLRAGEGQAVVLELDHSLGGLPAHVLNRVLVAEPVRALDRVVRVPPPVVLGHVTQRRVDPALRGDGVRPSGKQLRDARRLQTVLGQTDRGAKAGAAGADHHRVVLVVDDRVRRRA